MKQLKIDVILQDSGRGSYSNSKREKTVREIFGIGHMTNKRILHRGIDIPCKGLVYITGYSGSGKSCLLREIAKINPRAITKLPSLPKENSVLNCFKTDIAKSIQWLGFFGLGEAKILLTHAENLSDGQKERLRLALLLWTHPPMIILDEFLATLDRTTARIIAYQFQKLIRRFGITCFVATAHGDLEDALCPDVTVHLDFEGHYRISKKVAVYKKLPEINDIIIEDGTLEDYKTLQRFHYMDTQLGNSFWNAQDIVLIKRARINTTLVGVRIFSKIYPTSYEKINTFRWINQRAVLSARVVVHPTFRGLGIPKMMDFPLNSANGIQAIFAHSAMGRYFPFNIKNGYIPIKHVSEDKTLFHSLFEKTLQSTELKNIEYLNDAEFAIKFWSNLTGDERKNIRCTLADLLTDYDMRYLKYITDELKMNISDEMYNPLKKFFKRRIEVIPEKNFWKILTEGLYFPMQGFIRR